MHSWALTPRGSTSLKGHCSVSGKTFERHLGKQCRASGDSGSFPMCLTVLVWSELVATHVRIVQKSMKRFAPHFF